jgi:hypothetical protein
MTKNEYILPKEKPFETVYELKNEVPSYEEFMKTCQEDDTLNYADLGDGDISEVKGYGPCTDGRSFEDCYCSREELWNQRTINITSITIENNIFNIWENRWPGTTQRLINSDNINVTVFIPHNNYFAMLESSGPELSYPTWRMSGIGHYRWRLEKNLIGPNMWKTSKIVMSKRWELEQLEDGLYKFLSVDASGYDAYEEVAVFEKSWCGDNKNKQLAQRVHDKVRDLVKRFKRWEDINGEYSF